MPKGKKTNFSSVLRKNRKKMKIQGTKSSKKSDALNVKKMIGSMLDIEVGVFLMVWLLIIMQKWIMNSI